jgi:hypothetical protein
MDVGFTRIVVSSMATTPEVREVLIDLINTNPNTEFILSDMMADPGCNESWLRCGYMCPTKYLILLHDDDWLMPELAYHLTTIYDLLEEGKVGCCTWRADAVKDNGDRREIRHMKGNTQLTSTIALADIVMAFGHASLSPVVSVLRRDVLIHACKEADVFFDSNSDCWHNPGMPYGTEIIVYYRHAEKYQSWYYIDEALSGYGDHGGSGTIEAEQQGNWFKLIKGYDMARTYCAHHRGASLVPKPRIIYVYDPYCPSGPGNYRFTRAAEARRLVFEQGRVIPVEFPFTEYPSGKDMGDTSVPYLNDLLDHAGKIAMPEDYLCYTNSDICPIINFEHRMHQLFEDPRRQALSLKRQTYKKGYMPTPPFSEIRNGKSDNGVDGLICKNGWWLKYRSFFPRMFVGREAWDTVMRALVMESQPTLTQGDVEIPYTLAHEDHDPYWRDSINRRQNPGQRYNLQIAKNFFTVRRRTYGWVDGSIYSDGIPTLNKV